MLSVYSDDHRLHFGQSELVDGRLRSRPGGPGLAAQAQEQAKGSTAACGAGLAAQASLPRLRSRPRAMANWQSNICRLARLIESPFRS